MATLSGDAVLVSDMHPGIVESSHLVYLPETGVVKVEEKPFILHTGRMSR